MSDDPTLPAHHGWPESDKEMHASALRAIAQAAVNVELFTIPLYMGTMYSIQGTHQITGKNDFYEGRTWPGPGPTAAPDTPNELAFNIIFSVFIEEMLHLQMASNIATAIGVRPSFTSPALQDENYGWKCYGPGLSVIPHIVDLRHTDDYSNVKVDIAELSIDQLRLFLAIEAPEPHAQEQLRTLRKLNPAAYHPTVPFEGWTVEKTEEDLPMFGTIGWMYQCYLDYLNLTYTDGSTLWDYVVSFAPGSAQQRDLFNAKYRGHPEREFLGFETALTLPDPASALAEVKQMMNAITDQGEGATLVDRAIEPPSELGIELAVAPQYQADLDAMLKDYPDYDDRGASDPLSARAITRYRLGVEDHYERFTELLGFVDRVVTWRQWFNRGNRWTAKALQTDPPKKPQNDYKLPSAQAVADALNHMAHPEEMPVLMAGPSRDDYYRLMSKAAVGAIAGITTVLDKYWIDERLEFPYPSMYGSGDRMSICWAVFGEPPDLSSGIDKLDPKKLYHACQGLDFDSPGNDCAAVAVFHSCKGSNLCHAQGGCGFVQLVTGGSQCGGFAAATAKVVPADGSDDAPPVEPLFSAPSDNKCGGFGGCAIPISASQVFPAMTINNEPAEAGNMQLFDFVGTEHKAKELGKMPFKKGQKVHDVAYTAYLQVMAQRPDSPVVAPKAPEANILRLVFPPST
ncbi:MAG TPA: ferritin-like domain-containing protein [Acidimicrobiales bacterium]|nr:ferritin-like domain-containing protein [Acidimicrobiales bacterium]